MDRILDIEDRLLETAIRDITNKQLACALLEELPALSQVGVTDDIGWVVGLIDEPGDTEIRYCSYYFSGHTPEAEAALKTVLADLPAIAEADYISPQERIRRSGVMTIAVVACTVREGKPVWLLYSHPMIDMHLAGGYLLCSLESDRQRRLSLC